jgi:hypothetical protein
MPSILKRRRHLDEVYCSALRAAGAHGIWQPETWIWPGDTGYFHRGVFTRTDTLPREWRYELTWSEAPAQEFGFEEIWESGVSLGGGASDLFDVLSARGEIERRVSGANELVFLARPGRWWDIVNVKEVLERIRADFDQWAVGEMVVCSVFETSSAVMGVSSQSTGAFSVGVDAGGMPHLGVKVKAGVRADQASRHRARAAKTLPLKRGGEEASEDAKPEERKHYAYTPLFRQGYRVANRWLLPLGFKSLATSDGDLIHGRVARAEPEDLLFDPAEAEMSIEEVKEIPLDELFEEVTTEILSEEVDAELDTEIPEVRLKYLLDSGITMVDGVSVQRRHRSRIDEIRRRKIAESGSTKEIS